MNFPTTDPERTKEWYTKVFGLKAITPKSNTKVVLMTRGNFDLHFTAWHQQVWKPVITAVNGICCGGGFHWVADADIVVENFRPDVKHRLGIDYATLSASNPRLIYASISGFGQDGPYEKRPGVDQIAQGMSGLMSFTGEPGRGPMRVGIAVADLSAGLFAALGILTADCTPVLLADLAPGTTRELSGRAFPRIGVSEGMHSLSHHSDNAEKIEQLAKVNVHLLNLFVQYLDRLQHTQDGDGTLLIANTTAAIDEEKK